MEDSIHFNRLASELSVEERTKLLEKLSSQSSMTASKLYEESDNNEEFIAENSYNKLPWYYKIWFSIISFFKSRSPIKLYEDHIMAQLYRNLEDKYPGFYHYQKDLLLFRFQEELCKLRDGSRFFYHVLDASLNRDKGGLMIFLGSLEMPETHKAIIAKTDPEALFSHFSDLKEHGVRQQAIEAMEDAMAGITQEERTKMYHNAQSLFCLKQLSSFLFDRLINAFVHDASINGYICSAASAQDQLITLNNILSSLKTTPPISLLESIFIYVLVEKSDNPDLDIQNEMKRLLVQAETSLQIIRSFNQEVPLTRLLRCISRKPDLTPHNIGGGEDWFAVYKEHWKELVLENFYSFSKTKLEKDLQKSFQFFFKGTNLKVLENIDTGSSSLGIKFKGNYTLSFLLTFHSIVFMGDINNYLRPILTEGEFIKKENRTEFTESYNNLIKLEELIKRFDRSLSPAGDFGKRYEQARNEISSLPVKRRKIQLVQDEAAQTAERIINQARTALGELIKVLEGIQKKSDDDKYDTLSNLSVIAGKGTAFFDGITESISQFIKALQLMDDIETLETEQ
jgi:hypothetical protein